MSTKLKITGGTVEAVYDDRFSPIFEALGKTEVQRATDVEFDNATREWVAVLRLTGLEIARGPNRSEVISKEVAWLEANL